MDIAKMQERARKLEENYKLRNYPIALKFYEKAADAPEGTIFPLRDMKKHMALCQVFAYARMKGKTYGLTKEDHWCWTPLICYGCVDASPGTEAFEEVVKYIGIRDKDKARQFFADFPRLPLNKYEAVVVSPLRSAAFEPDVVLVYAEPAKINHMLRGIKSAVGGTISSVFDGIDSCIYSTIPPITQNEYRITLPDPGERERGRCRDEEIILSVPGKRLEEYFECQNLDSPFGAFNDFLLDCELDFPRPPFYNKLFELWGLEQGNDWEVRTK